MLAFASTGKTLTGVRFGARGRRGGGELAPHVIPPQLVRNEELGVHAPVADLAKAGTVLDAVVAVAIPAQGPHAQETLDPILEVGALGEPAANVAAATLGECKRGPSSRAAR